ncbi:uncharacterized protein MCYG_00599 [Microsporum canis CBS 113480]|uniref:Uncharacterized protein n=1 Tax=Arthroderma otae (strain ATCC MYA-4605 / CBS 113480) TaxID=554155 RepID=C5FD27_ARTOC|nr:uncharacterized protein MCYG_00599 [Microsporum canis CBS 113480]EEQ27711.1 predicted protein [Microsporum canis CBS 113480]
MDCLGLSGHGRMRRNQYGLRRMDVSIGVLLTNPSQQHDKGRRVRKIIMSGEEWGPASTRDVAAHAEETPKSSVIYHKLGPEALIKGVYLEQQPLFWIITLNASCFLQVIIQCAQMNYSITKRLNVERLNGRTSAAAEQDKSDNYLWTEERKWCGLKFEKGIQGFRIKGQPSHCWSS